MAYACTDCRHSALRTFVGREELRCLRFSPHTGAIGWSIVRERSPDPEFTDPNRCGPEAKHFAPKEDSL